MYSVQAHSTNSNTSSSYKYKDRFYTNERQAQVYKLCKNTVQIQIQTNPTNTREKCGSVGIGDWCKKTSTTRSQSWVSPVKSKKRSFLFRERNNLDVNCGYGDIEMYFLPIRLIMSNGGEKNVFLFSCKRFSSMWNQQRPKVFSLNLPNHVKVAE